MLVESNLSALQRMFELPEQAVQPAPRRHGVQQGQDSCGSQPCALPCTPALRALQLTRQTNSPLEGQPMGGQSTRCEHKLLVCSPEACLAFTTVRNMQYGRTWS